MLFDHDPEQGADAVMVVGRIKGLVNELDTFRTPQDQLMFMRALGIVIDVCREVYPEETVSEIVRPIVLPLLPRFLQENLQYIPWMMEQMKEVG